MVVAAGRVLIIESDEWVSTLLKNSLSQAGHEVHVAVEAREGLERARELAPDCILCDVVLPDIDGFWVARRLRAEAPDVASAPFLFLTDIDDPDARLQCLLVGADIFISKPIRHEEVVAQVGALIGMVQRLRKQESSAVPSRPEAAAALSGDISMLSVPTMLSMLEMERRTGTLEIKGESRTAVFELVEGHIAGVRLGDKPRESVEALREVLKWTRGAFGFSPEEVEGGGRKLHSIGALLLEAMRREDESGH
jgi:DNA-binding response OmpR family regulator